VWEPPTKKFYSKCQSSKELLSSQSERSIAASSCTGLQPASRQSIRDGHEDHQTVSGSSSTTQTTNKVRTGLHREATTLSQSTSQPTTRVLASRHGHHDEPAQSPASRLSRLVEIGTTLHPARTSYEQRSFQGLPWTVGVWCAWSHTGKTEIFLYWKFLVSILFCEFGNVQEHYEMLNIKVSGFLINWIYILHCTHLMSRFLSGRADSFSYASRPNLGKNIMCGMKTLNTSL
jgi:hypothetical protein